MAAARALEHLQGRGLPDAASLLYGQLGQLRHDFAAGLLNDLEAQVSAQTFDDLLDHAVAYLQERRPEPAAVLAGVVFEDTIRKLCRKHSIPSNDIQLDSLLSTLVTGGHLSPLERKEGTTAAALRTSATHARWDKFNAQQVDAVIHFTRRLLREKLAR